MFESSYQEMIYKRTYSRWLDAEGRRENWAETVSRYAQFFIKRVPEAYHPQFLQAIGAIGQLEVMPSMRSLWTAGPALERENICGYNCSYLTIDNIKAFAELLYILMCGTGAGFSVERQYVGKLPEVPTKFKIGIEPIVFRDSKLGWAEGYYKYLRGLYDGVIYPYDLSKIRPKGARLKTFGGRASGPEPLEDLLEFTRRVFENAKGRRLNSIECHDICCFIASVVVVGGVRRSACISLSNLSDDRMALSKSGEFWIINPQRSLANNSVAYTERPDTSKFIGEFLNLIKSNTGERGIFNRMSAKFTAEKTDRRDPHWDFGCNPCGEIILRPDQFCNLTEVVVRPDDTQQMLMEKVKYATILGCVQSTLTDFRFLNYMWRQNCEEERLLGVSLTGLMDHPILQNTNRDVRQSLVALKNTAIKTAREWSKILGINMPTAITTVKPSGTVSQLVDSSSGLHPRYAPFYIRRVRISSLDPVSQCLCDQGVLWDPEVGDNAVNPNTKVFSFPMKSPEGSKVVADVSALDQLRYWHMLKTSWCEHNPSCTVYVKDNEWTQVMAWVDKNWDDVSGITFLPQGTGVYKLAPYEEITKDRYEELQRTFPEFNFDNLSDYEKEDQTEGAQEFACAGGQCEI